MKTYSKILSTLLAMTLVITTFTSFVQPVRAVQYGTNSKKVLMPGLVDNLSTLDTGDWNGGTAYGKYNNPSGGWPAFWTGSQFGTNSAEFDGNTKDYWNNSVSARVIYPGFTDNAERNMVYNVKEDSYFAFTYYLGREFSAQTMSDIIFDNATAYPAAGIPGHGFRLASSSDNGATWQYQPLNDAFPVDSNPGAIFWPGTDLSGALIGNLDVIKYGTANYNGGTWGLGGVLLYLGVCNSYKIPAGATMVKIVYPEVSALKRGDTNVAWWPVFSALGTSKASKLPIDRSSKGDSVISTDYDTLPSFTSKDTTTTVITPTQIIFATGSTPGTLNQFKAKFNYTASALKVYNASGNEITSGLTQVPATGAKVHLVASGDAVIPNDTVIAVYNLIEGDISRPTLTSNDTSNVIVDEANSLITINTKPSLVDYTYNELSAKLSLFFCQINFVDTNDAAIANLDSTIAQGSKIKVLKADDLSLYQTFSLVVRPFEMWDPKSVLAPGITEYNQIYNGIANPAHSFTKYAMPLALDNLGYSNAAMSAEDGNYNWLGGSKTLQGNSLLNQYIYATASNPASSLEIRYNVLPNTYVGTVFVANESMPADLLAAAIRDVKFYTSPDGITYTETENPYVGVIGGDSRFGVDVAAFIDENDGNGTDPNYLGSEWLQILYNAKIPANARYLKVKFPQADFIRNGDKMHAYLDAGHTVIDTNTVYYWCSTHSRWDSGPNQQGSVAPHSILTYGGRIAPDKSYVAGMLFRMASTSASTTPFNVTSYGSSIVKFLDITADDDIDILDLAYTKNILLKNITVSRKQAETIKIGNPRAANVSISDLLYLKKYLLLQTPVNYNYNTDTRNFDFDSTITQTVLNNYLSKSATANGLISSSAYGSDPDGLNAKFSKDFKVLKDINALYYARAASIWGSMYNLDKYFSEIKEKAIIIHAYNSKIILEACIFEIISKDLVESVTIPSWVFAEFGITGNAALPRTFNFNDMVNTDYSADFWGTNKAVPDMARIEAQMWFYYLGKRYIDSGFESLNMGQMGMIGTKDIAASGAFKNLGTTNTFARLRNYAAVNARRHLVLLTAHVYSGSKVYKNGVTANGLLYDFHTFPLRSKDTGNVVQPDGFQPTTLEANYLDAIYGKSAAGLNPNGWVTTENPYAVEFDNSGYEKGALLNTANGNYWPWGCDEITWFARQPQNRRAEVLEYFDSWVTANSTNGHLSVPVRIPLAYDFNSSPVNVSNIGATTFTYNGVQITGGVNNFRANTQSDADQSGFNLQSAIKALWSRYNAN